MLKIPVRKVNMSTLSGFILQQLGVIMSPDILKRRSDGDDVAQAHILFGKPC